MALDPSKYSLNKNNWMRLLVPVADVEILVAYLEGDTSFEVLDRIEAITAGLKDNLEMKKRAIQEPDS